MVTNPHLSFFKKIHISLEDSNGHLFFKNQHDVYYSKKELPNTSHIAIIRLLALISKLIRTVPGYN